MKFSPPEDKAIREKRKESRSKLLSAQAAVIEATRPCVTEGLSL
jgi:hypothetical protein